MTSNLLKELLTRHNSMYGVSLGMRLSNMPSAATGEEDRGKQNLDFDTGKQQIACKKLIRYLHDRRQEKISLLF